MADEEPGQITVYEICDRGYSDAIEIRQLVELLKSENVGEAFIHLANRDGETAGMILRNSLLSRLVILVTRVYSIPRSDDLHLGRAIQLLGDSSVRKEIETRGPTGSLASALADWERLSADDRLKVVKHFRDKFTAHLGRPSPDVSPPEFGLLSQFAYETSVLLDRFALATGERFESVDTWNEQIRNAANIFWKPWREDPPG